MRTAPDRRDVGIDLPIPTGRAGLPWARVGLSPASATVTLASSAMTPLSSASSGLMSISRISGWSRDEIAEPHQRFGNAVRRRRLGDRDSPAAERQTRVCRIRSRARLRSSGGSACAVSRSTSTAVPPAPNIMSGPKVGSTDMPRISSWARGRRIIGCTVKPLMLASGIRLRDRARSMSSAARSASSACSSPSRTPPTSDLCEMSSDRILTTQAPCSRDDALRQRARPPLGSRQSRSAPPECRRRRAAPWPPTSDSIDAPCRERSGIGSLRPPWRCRRPDLRAAMAACASAPPARARSARAA